MMNDAIRTFFLCIVLFFAGAITAYLSDEESVQEYQQEIEILNNRIDSLKTNCNG